MSRICCHIALFVVFALILVCPCIAFAQSPNATAAIGQTLATVPAPVQFARGMGIGIVLSLACLCVGVRLSRVYR